MCTFVNLWNIGWSPCSVFWPHAYPSDVEWLNFQLPVIKILHWLYDCCFSTNRDVQLSLAEPLKHVAQGWTSFAKPAPVLLNAAKSASSWLNVIIYKFIKLVQVSILEPSLNSLCCVTAVHIINRGGCWTSRCEHEFHLLIKVYSHECDLRHDLRHFKVTKLGLTERAIKA